MLHFINKCDKCGNNIKWKKKLTTNSEKENKHVFL